MKLRYVKYTAFIVLCVFCLPWLSRTQASAAVDRFGIKMLHATVHGGREWFNGWDAGPERTITWGPDSRDPQFIIRGNTRCVVYGAAGANAGQAKVSGSGPRLYVRGTASEAVPPPPGTPTWNNVEVTFYARTTNAGSKVVYAGLEAVCKTNHCPDSDDPTTRGYGGRVLFDGRVDIEKELSHAKGSNIRSFPAFIWTEADGGPRSENASLVSNNNGRPVYEMPLNKWIGYKLVARNCDHGVNVLLEVYIDRSGGINGGDWKLAKSLKDIVYSPSVDALYFSKDLLVQRRRLQAQGLGNPGTTRHADHAAELQRLPENGRQRGAVRQVVQRPRSRAGGLVGLTPCPSSRARV